MEPNPETNKEIIPDGRSNMEICPNCLEPNPDDLAVCSYCGMPLHPVDEDTAAVMTEDEQTLAAARAEAIPAEKKPDKKKKEQSGFRRIMPWLGLYLIYNAIISCIEIGQQRKLPTEEQPNYGLAYLSTAIWFAAGLLMAWPLVKKGWRKLRHLPDEEEEEVKPETPQEENESDKQAENEPVPETEEAEEAEFSEDGSDPEYGKEEPEEEPTEEHPDPDPVLTDEEPEEQEAEGADGEPTE